MVKFLRFQPNSGFVFYMVLVASLVLGASPISAQTYCSPTGTYSGNNARINNVTITGGGLNNSNSTLSGGYQNFTGTVAAATVTQGTAYTFSINRTLDFASSYGIKIWIDYDNNGTFDNFTTPQGEVIMILASNTTATRTGSYTIPTTVTTSTGTYNTAGTWRMRVRNAFNSSTTPANMQPCTHYNFSEAEDYLITIAPNTPMTYVSSTTTQNTANVDPNTTNNHVIGIQVVTSGVSSPLNATSFTINTNGTTNTADITNAKIFSTGASATFATGTQFGSTVASPNGSFSITGTRALVTGTNYFWLTYDVPSGATIGNVIDAECTSLTVGSAQTPTVTAPAGSRLISEMAYNSSTTTQNNAILQANTTNQQLVQLQVVTTGIANPIAVTQIAFNTNGSDNAPTDISNAKIWYTGTSSTFATTTQFGSTLTSPNGTHSITGSQALATGTNYFWLTYDIAPGATIANFVSAAITAVEVDGNPVTPSNTATANRQIGYCTPTATCAAGCSSSGGYGFITTVNVAGTTLNNTASTPNTGYTDFYSSVAAADVIQGNTYNFTITRGSDGFTQYGLEIWIDINNDGTFTNTTYDGISNPGGERFFVMSPTNTSNTVSGSFTIPSTTSLGNHRMRIRNRRSSNTANPCGNYDYGEVEDYKLNVILSTPMVYVSSTTTQNTADVGVNTTNQQVIGIPVTMSGSLSPLALTALDFNITGTTTAADITNAKIWYTGTSATFSTGTQFGSTVVSPTGSHTASGSVVLAHGINYFWLTYDVPSGATIGNLVDAECTSLTIGGTPYVPTATAPAGARQIQYLYCTPTATCLFGCSSSGGYGYITNVTITGTTLNNTNTTPNTGYTDFSSVTPPDLTPGNTYNFTITRGTDGFTNYGFEIWIDVNNDGAFDNTDYDAGTNPTGERFYVMPAVNTSSSVSGSFTLPATISAGNHRMRFRNKRSGNAAHPCNNYDYGEAEDYKINILPSTVTWVGPANGSWHTAANWSPAIVPNSCGAEVVINVGGTPVISANDISVGDISVASGATITLNGMDLNVCGTWTGGGGTNAAVVGTGTTYINSSSAAQTIEGRTRFDVLQINNANGVSLASGAIVSIGTGLHLQAGDFDVSAGTLRLLSTAANHHSYIDNFTNLYAGTLTGNIIADRYVPVSGYNQHFISSPLSNAALSQIGASGPDGSFIKPTADCDETKSDPSTPYGSVFTYVDGSAAPGSCMMGNWRVTSAGNMAGGKGYSAYLTGNSIVSLNGTPNTGNVTVTNLNHSGYPDVFTLQGQPIQAGWNLVGNPYPSAIDLTTDRTAYGFGNQVQVWETSGPFAGSWQPHTITGVPGQVVIPPFQSFMVLKTSAGSGSYPFFQAERSRAITSFYRQPSDNTLLLEVDYNGLKDMTTIEFNQQATDGYDPAFDANKQGSVGRPTIYTTMSNNSNRWYGINVMQPLTETTPVPVGLRPEVNGVMVITAQGIQSFDPTTYILLEDKKTKTWHNLRNGSYTFSAEKADVKERFVLHFTAPAQVITSDASCDFNGLISIAQSGNTNWNYMVSDHNNTVLSVGVLSKYNPVNVSAPAGTYTLTLSDNNGYTVSKTIQVGGFQQVTASFNATAHTAMAYEEITFNSTSAAGHCSWDFGDGSQQVGNTVVHSYANEGVYNVTLTVTSTEGCTSASARTLTVTSRSTTGMDDVTGNSQLPVWSNGNKVYIDFSKLAKVDAGIEIYNVLGQLLSSEKFGRSTVYTKDIPNTGASYIIVKVRNGNELAAKKLFIANR